MDGGCKVMKLTLAYALLTSVDELSCRPIGCRAMMERAGRDVSVVRDVRRVGRELKGWMGMRSQAARGGGTLQFLFFTNN